MHGMRSVPVLLLLIALLHSSAAAGSDQQGTPKTEPTTAPRLFDPSLKCATEAQPVPLPPQHRPAYTLEMQRAGLTGKVMLEGVIAIDGSLRKLTVVKSSDDRLSRIAMAAMKDWKFKPALCDGKPVEVYVVERFGFGVR